MRAFFIIALCVIGFFSCKESPQREQIVHFDSDVTVSDRKKALTQLAAEGVELMQGNPEIDHYFLMKSTKLINCKNCWAMLNVHCEVDGEPCEHCHRSDSLLTRCCPTNTLEIVPSMFLSDSMSTDRENAQVDTTLYGVITKMELGRAIRNSPTSQKLDAIAVSLNVADTNDPQSVKKLMKLEEALLKKRSRIELISLLNGKVVTKSMNPK